MPQFPVALLPFGAAVTAAVLCMIVGLGCGPDAEPNDRSQAIAPTIAAESVLEELPPLDAIPKSGPEFLEAISATKSFSLLHDLEMRRRASGETSVEADTSFAAAWRRLLASVQPRSFIEGMEFLDVHTAATGENEYTFSLWLRASSDLEADYHITLQGFVFPANDAAVPEARRDEGYVEWTLPVYVPPTSQWKAGDHHVIRMAVPTPHVPYNLRALLHTRDEQFLWKESVGESLALGWQWALLERETFIERIAACKDAASLYALAPAGPRLPVPVASAVAQKWTELTAGLTPRPLNDELEYWDVDLKATGREEYTVSVLLRAAQDVGADYHLGMTALVDRSFVHLITPDKPNGNYTTWSLLLYNDLTSRWRAGEFHVAQLRVATPIIPYDLSISLQTRGEQREWTGNVGNAIELGWQADVSE